MRYVISIDWLSIFCYYTGSDESWHGVSGSSEHIGDAYPWRYVTEPYGTRQFKRLTRVSMPNEEGGRDDFAEVQSEPYSHKILHTRSVIVRFVNRVLYRPDFWELASIFLRDNCIEYRSISRVDICSDFNDFTSISPRALIEGFANKVYRHVGRGVGALYFNHGIFRKELTDTREYGVNYTGLSFGTHASDARVYLYNKSFELVTQGDKPWIRDRWMHAGLDLRTVWRLEVSLKSKACTFRDRTFKQDIKIDTNMCQDDEQLTMLYQTFVRKLFAFVVNRAGITNISREPRLRLFDGSPWVDRGVIRNVSAANRLDKMVIKSLYLMADTYRGSDAINCDGYASTLAYVIAESTDLTDWMLEKSKTWEQITHK